MTGQGSKKRSRTELADGDIRTRAYHIWESEGRPGDREVEHWLKARGELENEIKAPRSGKAAAAKTAPRKRAAASAAKSTSKTAKAKTKAKAR